MLQAVMRQDAPTVEVVVMDAQGVALENAQTHVQAAVAYVRDRVRVCVIILESKLWTRRNLSIVEAFLEKVLLQ